MEAVCQLRPKRILPDFSNHAYRASKTLGRDGLIGSFSSQERPEARTGNCFTGHRHPCCHCDQIETYAPYNNDFLWHADSNGRIRKRRLKETDQNPASSAYSASPAPLALLVFTAAIASISKRAPTSKPATCTIVLAGGESGKVSLRMRW